MACDPYFADVNLLLHCDGSNGSTSFPDSSSLGVIVTDLGATVSTTAPEFGTGCGAFGVSKALSAPIVTGGQLDLQAAGTWTVEGWVKLETGISTSIELIFSDLDSATGHFCRLYFIASGTTGELLECQTSGTGITSANGPASVTVKDGNWHAFAVVADIAAGTLQVFADGIGGTPITHYVGWATTNPSSHFYLGTDYTIIVDSQSNWLHGQLDEIRVTQGFARYTSNYTPAGPFGDGACATVPNVVGEALASAESDIVAAGFVVGTETPQVSLTVPDGDVISQNPAGGTYEVAGSSVDLVYSIGDSFSAPVLSGSVPNPVTQPLAGVLTWTESLDGATPAPGYDIYRDGVSIATVGAVLTYTDTVPTAGTYTYNVAAYDSTIPADISAQSNSLPLTYSGSVVGFPNCIFDEAIFGGYFGGLLNLVEFTYMPGRTPFEEGATNLIINRYKQEPTDVRQRGVDFTQFVVPGELLQTVAVTGISAQGVLQDATNPLVIPLVVTDLIIDPVTQLKFGYTVSGGQNGIEYTVQFTTTTNIQTETLEEIFSINVLVEDSFP